MQNLYDTRESEVIIMVVNFGGINVLVTTATEDMLFSWMLFHKDVKEFRIGNTYFELIDHSYEEAKVKVSPEEGYVTEITIDHPYDWKINDNIVDGDIHDLIYNKAGDYTAVFSDGHISIGTSLDGDISLSFNTDNYFELDDVKLSNRIYPEIKTLGFDEDGMYLYQINFKDYADLTLFYDAANPLDSYVTE